MPQDDPPPQICRWLYVYRANRGGLIERVFELREVGRARVAGFDVRGDDRALFLVERAERVGREIFGGMMLLAHRSSSRLSRSLFMASRTRRVTVLSGVSGCATYLAV